LLEPDRGYENSCPTTLSVGFGDAQRPNIFIICLPVFYLLVSLESLTGNADRRQALAAEAQARSHDRLTIYVKMIILANQ
jgi:hypothetical protein